MSQLIPPLPFAPQSIATSPNLQSLIETSAQPGMLIEGDPLIYKYDPRTTLALGRGFSPNDISAPKRSAIEFREKSLDAGAPSTSFKITFVQTEDQLDASMSLDSKAEATYLGAKAESRSSFKFGFGIKRKSVVIVITAFTDFGRWSLSDEKLTDEAKQTLGSPTKFVENFGSRYVAIERRGAIVSVVAIMHAVDSQMRVDFESEFGGGGGWGPVEASAKAKLTTMLKISAKQGQLDVEVMATGGQGLSGLKGIAQGVLSNSEDPFSSVKDALEQYLAGFNKDNASPIEYTVAPMSRFGLNENGIDPWTDENERRLLLLVRRYRLAREALDTMPAIRSGQHVLCTIFKREEIWDIVNSQLDLDNYIGAIAKLHKEVKLNPDTPDSLQYPPHISRLINYLDILKTPPALSMSETSFGMSNTQLRSILRVPPGKRLALAKEFFPKSPENSIHIFYSVDAIFDFHSIVYVYEYAGDPPSESREDPWDGHMGIPWSIEPDIVTIDAYERTLYKWLAKHNGSFDVLISLKMRDKVGHIYKIGFVNYKFTAGAGTIGSLETNILF
ncbi:hypothetical protein D3C86_714150 [compost metagenome]